MKDASFLCIHGLPLSPDNSNTGFQPSTVSEELTQPTPRIPNVFMPGNFLCQPYTPEYAFICILSIGSLMGLGIALKLSKDDSSGCGMGFGLPTGY